MGLFEVLITNMLFICGSNNNLCIKYSLVILVIRSHPPKNPGFKTFSRRMMGEYLILELLFAPQMSITFVISTSNNPIINKIYA